MAETAGSKSSTDPGAPASTPERIAVGRVSGVHGLRGNLVVRCLGDAENLLACSSVWLADGEDTSDPTQYDVDGAAPGRRAEVRMRLAGVDDRSAAEGLVGRTVLLDVGQLAALAEGEYYSYQLVGCAVEGDDGRALGRVTEIWSTGAPDVLVVDDDGGARHLIPAAAGLLREVDIERRRIVVELLPGLIEEPADGD